MTKLQKTINFKKKKIFFNNNKKPNADQFRINFATINFVLTKYSIKNNRSNEKTLSILLSGICFL